MRHTDLRSGPIVSRDTPIYRESSKWDRGTAPLFPGPSFIWSLVHRPPNPPSYRHCFPYFSCLPWFPNCLLNELCPSMSCQQKLQTPLHWPWPSSHLTRPDPQLLCTNVPGIVPSVASTWSVKYKVLGSCGVPKCPHCTMCCLGSHVPQCPKYPLCETLGYDAVSGWV